MILSDEYRDWNRRLLEYCQEHSVDGVTKNVYLTVEPFLEAQPESDAEEMFVECVREAFLQSFKVNYGDPLPAFCQTVDALPASAALLGVTVLAAGDMDNNAYYEHLANHLNKGNEAIRDSFASPSVETLWEQLQTYFQEVGFILPSPPGKERRYIRYPKQHALLRQMDVRKLVCFFTDYHLSPQFIYSDERLSCHFSGWVGKAPSPLTPCGKNAWNDSTRRNAVLRQVRNALEYWDESAYKRWKRQSEPVAGGGWHNGGIGSSENKERPLDRIARLPVCLSLDVDEGKGTIKFQVTPPNTFNGILPFAGEEFTCRQGRSSYITVSDTAHADTLKKGVEGGTETLRVSFRREEEKENTIFLFIEDEWNGGYVQTERLQLGAKCAILCKIEFEGRIREWLNREVCRQVTSRSPSLPDCLNNEWVVLADFTPRHAEVAPPPGMPSLLIETELGVRFRGGLRLDSHRNEWMENAPPTPYLVGKPLPPTAKVDDFEVAVKVDDGSYLGTEALLSQRGEHKIFALADTSSPINRTITIATPRLCVTRDDAMLEELFSEFHSPFVLKVTVPVAQPKQVVTPPPTMVVVPKSPVIAPITSLPDDGIRYDWYFLGESPGSARCLLRYKTSEECLRYFTNFSSHADLGIAWTVGVAQSYATIIAINLAPPRPLKPKPLGGRRALNLRSWAETILDVEQLPFKRWHSISVDRVQNQGTMRSIWGQYVQCARICRSQSASQGKKR